MDKKIFRKLGVEPLYVQIVHQIEHLIQQAILKPGDMLPTESALANELGTSRPPLREALSALEMLGIIERRGGRRNFISADVDFIRYKGYKSQLRQLSHDASPFESLQARKIVEPEIARLAAETGSKKDMKTVEKTFREMELEVKRIDSPLTLEDAIGHDIKFHLSIADATHNTILAETIGYMLAGLRHKLMANIKVHHVNFRRRFQKTLLEHREVLDALIRKNALMAREKMYKHLESAERELFGTSERS